MVDILLSQLFIYTKVKEWVPESLMDTIKSVIGAKYLKFFSSRSLKTREKYVDFAQLVYFLRKMCLLFNSIIQKSKSNTLLSKIYKLSKTNTFFSRFEGTRGEKNQIFRTIEPNTQELTQDISVSKLQEMFDEITKKLLAKLVLIKPTEFLLCGNDLKWNDLSKDDQKTLQALIIDTMDVIEFKDFNQGRGVPSFS